jgi:hypothetical protein
VGAVVYAHVGWRHRLYIPNSLSSRPQKQQTKGQAQLRGSKPSCTDQIAAQECNTKGNRVAAIPELLTKIPDEYKPLAALAIGAFVLVFIALFHGSALHWILVLQRCGERRLRVGRPRVIAASFLFGWSVFLMLDLHLVEVLIWAFAITRMGLVVHAYDAIYFCANAYTTLGMGKMDVEEHWHIITPVVAISGLFTFAWTTSALVDVVTANRRLLERLEDEREQVMHMRFAMRKKAWEALRAERDAEHTKKDKIEVQAAEVSFLERYKLWREERMEVAALRRAKATEIEALRQKERQEEKKLPGTPPADSVDKKQP